MPMAIKDASASIRLDEECMSFVRMDATKGIKTAKNEKVMMVFSVPPPKLYNKMPPGIRNRKTALTMVVYRLNEFSIEKEYFVMKSA